MNWVSEGWLPFEVNCTIDKISKVVLNKPLFVFFQFDNYRPWLIEPNDKGL